MRILCLDVGEKRIGVAISDAMGWTAQGLTVIKRNSDTLVEIGKLVSEYQVTKIVVGKPLSMSGKESAQTHRVKEFCEEIKAVIDLPVVEWDERLTTMEAERLLIDSDVSRSKRKKVIDKVASVLILQNYLDYLSFQRR